jgi:hypothetical protein
MSPIPETQFRAALRARDASTITSGLTLLIGGFLIGSNFHLGTWWLILVAAVGCVMCGLTEVFNRRWNRMIRNTSLNPKTAARAHEEDASSNEMPRQVLRVDPAVVERVEDNHGSHIEPPLDQQWSDAEKLAWHAGVELVDSGLRAVLTLWSDGTWSINAGPISMHNGMTFYDAWNAITMMGIGAGAVAGRRTND